MRQILISLGFIAFVVFVLTKGTLSFFSNTEILDDNFGIAGQINLLIGNTAYKNSQIIPELTWDLQDQISGSLLAFENLLPGDSGSNTVSFQITDNPAWLCSQINSNLPSESDKHFKIFLWADDGDGVFEDNESQILSSQLNQINQIPVTLATKNINYFDSTSYLPITPNSIHHLGLSWCVGELNMTPVNQDFNNHQLSPQTQSFFECNQTLDEINSFNSDLSLSFYAVQARNNQDFTCQ